MNKLHVLAVAVTISVTSAAAVAQNVPMPQPSFSLEGGNAVFHHGATLDFTGLAGAGWVYNTSDRPRFVVVYVNGEPHLMPVYRATRAGQMTGVVKPKGIVLAE